jgi:hypothetical protein
MKPSMKGNSLNHSEGIQIRWNNLPNSMLSRDQRVRLDMSKLKTNLSRWLELNNMLLNIVTILSTLVLPTLLLILLKPCSKLLLK